AAAAEGGARRLLDGAPCLVVVGRGHQRGRGAHRRLHAVPRRGGEGDRGERDRECGGIHARAPPDLEPREAWKRRADPRTGPSRVAFGALRRDHLPVWLVVPLAPMSYLVERECEAFDATFLRSDFASARALSSSAFACFLHADFSLPFMSSHFSLATS